MPGLDDLLQRLGLVRPPPQQFDPAVLDQMKVPWNQQIGDMAPIVGMAALSPTLPAAMAAPAAHMLMESGKLGDQK